MRIRGIELVALKLKLKDRFETSFGAVDEREILLVRLEAEAGVSWSEVVADRDPYYSGETVETARHIIREFLAPLLRETAVSGGRDAFRICSRVRGNPMARAAVEMGIWNLEAMEKGVPLSHLLGGNRSRVAAGVSVGIQESAPAMLDKIAAYLDRGYCRIKVKIKPGKDVDIIRSIRRRFPDIHLMADANAAYTLDDSPLLAALDDYRLMMIEQPLSHDDILDHGELARILRTPICLDESIRSSHDCRLALQLKSCSIINIKPGRVAGFTESIAIHDACREASVPVWCGGMLESGIGRAYNVHLATMPNFELPGDISESARYWAEDIVEPTWVLREGHLDVPTGPGLGVKVREDLIEKYAIARERIV
ncbi:MAG: o-succinylbenzoate synthase [Acidobacteria bacterium]|nr:o-succinylbenzoate synthase [Acidobacteriota bacterium]